MGSLIRWSKSFTEIHSYRLPLDCYFGFPMSSSCLPLDYLLDDTPLNCSTRQNTEDLFNGPKAYFQDLREDKMTNALVGKATVSITCIAPTENAAETMREFFKDHMEFMKAKSHQEGPLKLLMYSISESPEWKENTSWTEGKYTEKTGEQSLIYMKFTIMKRACITIGLNQQSTYPFLHNSQKYIKLNG